MTPPTVFGIRQQFGKRIFDDTAAMCKPFPGHNGVNVSAGLNGVVCSPKEFKGLFVISHERPINES
jgi:hypothetical protein